MRIREEENRSEQRFNRIITEQKCKRYIIEQLTNLIESIQQKEEVNYNTKLVALADHIKEMKTNILEDLQFQQLRKKMIAFLENGDNLDLTTIAINFIVTLTFYEGSQWPKSRKMIDFLPLFILNLRNRNSKIRQLALIAIGNFIIDYPQEFIWQKGDIQIINLLQTEENPQIISNCYWALHNICMTFSSFYFQFVFLSLKYLCTDLINKNRYLKDEQMIIYLLLEKFSRHKELYIIIQELNLMKIFVKKLAMEAKTAMTVLKVLVNQLEVNPHILPKLVLHNIQTFALEMMINYQSNLEFQPFRHFFGMIQRNKDRALVYNMKNKELLLFIKDQMIERDLDASFYRIFKNLIEDCDSQQVYDFICKYKIIYLYVSQIADDDFIPKLTILEALEAFILFGEQIEQGTNKIVKELHHLSVMELMQAMMDNQDEKIFEMAIRINFILQKMEIFSSVSTQIKFINCEQVQDSVN